MRRDSTSPKSACRHGRPRPPSREQARMIMTFRQVSGSSFQRNNPESRAMTKHIKLFLFTGWLLPVAIALTYFARWIREIVVPTLKGGSFEQLYDLNGVRYLDTTLVF